MLSCAAARPLRAADSGSAVQEKSAEVERLRRSLEQAEKDLQELQRENERLRRQQERDTRQKATDAAREKDRELRQLREENERLRRSRDREPRPEPKEPAEVKAARPMVGLPALQATDVVEAGELVAHFATDASAATARYGKQTFRVKGVVDRFSSGLVTRQFTVLLTSPDRAFTVACRFSYIDRYKTVFTSQNGRALKARYDGGGETTLLEEGQVVVVSGRCDGLDRDGQIRFSRCEIVR